jgi:hypothetical protein
VSDRKYRQPGYQDRERQNGKEPQQKSGPRPKGDMTYGPRAIQMAPTRTISRCAHCGVVLPAGVDVNGKCPQCNAALHACKQCAQFVPGRRFECRLAVPGYAKKDLHNDCAKFTLNTRVERQTSTGSSASSTSTSASNPNLDARRAFENLFKK